MLELKNLSLRLPDHDLIKAFSIAIAAGEVVTLMGQSGSGKSSLLSLISGDLAPTFQASGDVVLNGASILDLPPEKRKIGRLFQDDLLFPHMTVAENLLFATPAGSKPERLKQMTTALQQAGLDGFAHRAPHTLSGGQRQRVALMRCLLAQPEAILLDEPFSKLDAALRGDMRAFVFDHINSRGIPALLVTHDTSDAPAHGRILGIENSEVRHA
jgi:putative thiamine transport system ATP-binding protein